MQIDKFKLEFAELFNDFIKSNEFHFLLKSKFDDIKKNLSQFKNQSITFPHLAKNVFEAFE